MLIGLLLIVHFLESRGYLYQSQTAFGLDWWLQREAPKTQFDVSVVEITDDDYRDYFCGESPLDGRALVALVEAVRDTLKPNVIGVDLDTSDWGESVPMTCTTLNERHLFRQDLERAGKQVDPVWLRGEVDKLAPGSSTAPVIVWAQIPGDPEPRAVSETLCAHMARCWKLMWKGEREEKTALSLQKVVGKEISRHTETKKQIDSIGIPRFPVDADGVVRKYRRRYWVIEHPTPADSLTYEMNSLPHALATACKQCSRYDEWQTEEENHSDDDTILKFVGDQYAFKAIDAKHLLQPIEDKASSMTANASDQAGTSPAPETDTAKALSLRPSKIVIIGGTYKGARDIYRTPLGNVAGVRLLAHAVETDLHEGIEESTESLKLLAEGMAAVVFIGLWRFLSRHVALWIVFLLSPLGVLLASYFVGGILFRHGIWLDSIAIFAGVVVHQTTEELALIEEKDSELEHYEGEIETRDKTIHRLADELASLRPPAPTPDPNAPAKPETPKEKPSS